MNRPQTRDGLPQPQRRRAMLVVLTGLSMSVLDGAIANIALPTIAAELRTDPANAVWVVNAYQLAVTISLLPFASLGELRGYRRVFIGGLAVFTLGSLACALSGSLTTLVASRILQGFGGAGIMSVNTALLRFIYPADQLGRGIGINALVGSISAAIGPSVAAGILSIASWQWLFAINVPLGVVALMFARRELPRTPLARHRFDWLSAGLSAATFGALIIGIDNLRRLSMAVAFELAGAAVAGALFIWRQRMLAYPMLALELFARPVSALSVVGSICSFTAQNLTFVSLPFFLEEVLGRSAVETALLMTPWPIGARLNSAFQQMVYAHGYDHNSVLNQRPGNSINFAARAYDPCTGPRDRLLHHRAGCAARYQQRPEQLGGRVVGPDLSPDRGIHARDAAFRGQPQQAQLSDGEVEAGAGVPFDDDLPLRDRCAPSRPLPRSGQITAFAPVIL